MTNTLNAQELDALVRSGESYTLEFKERPDKSLASEVSAFANASGGRVVIGVTDQGVVVGTDTSNAARSRVQDTLNAIEPRLQTTLSVVENLIVITVPEGRKKPYSCPQGFYLRSGPNAQKMKRDDIVDFLHAEGRFRYDTVAREELLVADNFNADTFQDFLTKANITGILSRDTLLINLGCAKLVAGKLVYTNAGGLFFRNNQDDVAYLQAKVICALYKGNEKVIILDAQELHGGIMENIERALIFLQRNLRMRYVISGIRRENIPELPLEALREAVINAICHRDYAEEGASVMVEIFDNRVDITNPGGLPKGVTKENFGTVSVARNGVVANLLHRAHYIEKMGTGILRMQRAADARKIPAPTFSFDGFFRISFPRPELAADEIASVGENIVTRVETEETRVESTGTRVETGEARVENTGTRVEIGETRVEIPDAKAEDMGTRDFILAAIRDNPLVTTPDLAKATGMTLKGMEWHLRKLRDEKRIIHVGPTKGGRWEVVLHGLL